MAHQGQLTQREKYDDVLRRGVGQAVQQAANRTIPTKAQQFGKMAPLSSATERTWKNIRAPTNLAQNGREMLPGRKSPVPLITKFLKNNKS